MNLRDILKVKSEISDLMRLGPNQDSGYVVSFPALIASDVLYNYGVGNEYRFEKEYAQMFQNKNVKMFDPTIGSFAVYEPNISFFEDGIFVYENNNTSFEKHLKHFGDEDKNVFLKFDIEGCEYDFLNSINKNYLKNVVGIVGEFHWLFDKKNKNALINILTTTLDNFDIVHIHGNNHGPMLDPIADELEDFKLPSTIELSFIRKDLNTCSNYVDRNYPIIGLDWPNSLSLPDQEFSVFQ
jgi:hypothetical protein